MIRRPIVVWSLVCVLLACVACGGASTASLPSNSSPATTTVDAVDGNQIRLTAAESSRLVSWAETFRACMLENGAALGPLEKSETQIRMALPANVDVEDVVAKTGRCGERQGGPPHRASLQYRPGEIVLYLPKQCLLDKKVASS
jgi:hypothetical protein